MQIAHLSDIHFGRIVQPRIVEHLVADINAHEVDLVAVSGDLTQRARRWQFQAAAEMLDRFDAPTLVVPGNHDVHAWWYLVARLFNPLSRYTEFISEDLIPSFDAPGLAVLGINSATGRTVKGGHIGREARAAVRSYFAGHPAEVFKVLVVHHHLVKIQALGVHDVVRQARDTLKAASEVGVDLVLCGHLHISHIESIDVIPGKHRLIIASAGTATSSRGRKTNRKTNFYNVISVEPEAFSIEERRYDPDREVFVSEGTMQFARDLHDVSS